MDLSSPFSETAKSEYDGSLVLLHHLGNYHDDDIDDNNEDNSEDGDDLDAETEGQGEGDEDGNDRNSGEEKGRRARALRVSWK